MKPFRLLGGIIAALLLFATAALFSRQQGATGDVYAVTRHGDYYQWEYRYWKYGQSVQPFSTDGHSLGQRFDAGGGMYEVVDDDGTIVVKKDGSTIHSMGKGISDANIISLFASGGDVYAGGHEIGAKGKWVATVWKNGEVHKRLSNGEANANVKALSLSGGDIFAGGNEANTEGWTTATISKNGKLLQRLTDGDYYDSEVFSLCVSGGDVYAGGYGFDEKQGIVYATVWKNGKVCQRLTDSSNTTVVYSISVSGGDFYSGGHSGHKPTVWKNGEFLYKLGEDDGNVALVFIK
jgi:hypothetical protein